MTASSIQTVFFVCLYLQIEEVEVTTEDQTRPSISDTEFTSIFKRAVDKAATNIQNDKLLRNPKSKHGEGIMRLVLFCTTFNFIEFCFKLLFGSFLTMFQRLPVKPSEREKLFSEFHKLRCNKDIENKFVQAFECESIPKVKVYFFQMFINALLQGVLDEILLYHKSCDDFKQYISNESEQQILFYICGFILNKLKKMSCKVLAPFSDVISSFYDKNVQNLEFVKNVSAWTQKLDRGGLKYPSKYFFFSCKGS